MRLSWPCCCSSPCRRRPLVTGVGFSWLMSNGGDLTRLDHHRSAARRNGMVLLRLRCGGAVRWLLMLCEVAVASLAAACAPWPLGGRLDPRSSGLAGEWAASPVQGSSDTVVWRFRGDGRYEILRAGASRGPGGYTSTVSIARGRWEVYQDAQGDPRPLVCFDRRARRWPSCRYFEVDSVIDATGGAHRVLTWEGWVGETRRTTATLTERVP